MHWKPRPVSSAIRYGYQTQQHSIMAWFSSLFVIPLLFHPFLSLSLSLSSLSLSLSIFLASFFSSFSFRFILCLTCCVSLFLISILLLSMLLNRTPTVLRWAMPKEKNSPKTAHTKGNPIGYGHEGDAETARLTWNTKIETDTCLRQEHNTHSIGFIRCCLPPTFPNSEMPYRRPCVPVHTIDCLSSII